MTIKKVEKLHLWTNGDSGTGISGESAEVSAPGWLISSEHFEQEGFNATLEEFRERVREAFEVIWPNDMVYAQYDFELREENAALEAVAG